MKKRMVGLLLALVVSAGLLGCEGSPKQGQEPGTGQPSDEAGAGGDLSEDTGSKGTEPEGTGSEDTGSKGTKPEGTGPKGAESEDGSAEALSEEEVAAWNEKALALIDENKTYTVEEFQELMKNICETVGSEYDSDLVWKPQGVPGTKTLNLNGKKLKEVLNEEQFVWWLMLGPSGNDQMDVYYYIEDGTDTSGDFQALLFSRYHQDE